MCVRVCVCVSVCLFSNRVWPWRLPATSCSPNSTGILGTWSRPRIGRTASARRPRSTCTTSSPRAPSTLSCGQCSTARSANPSSSWSPHSFEFEGEKNVSLDVVTLRSKEFFLMQLQLLNRHHLTQKRGNKIKILVCLVSKQTSSVCLSIFGVVGLNIQAS